MSGMKQIQPKHHIGKTKAQVQARRKTIFKAIADNKTQQEAGELAGYNANSAYSQVSQILKSPSAINSFKAILDKKINDQKLSDKYNELLSATKVISAVIVNNKTNPTSQADGELPLADSQTKDFIEVPDYPTQLKTADSISKLKGHMTDGVQVNQQFNWGQLTDQQLQDIINGKMPKDIT
jgi:hypothetical protein